ncbi:MAG TPA: PAS and helix-turn-helix domain-containing protein [Terriglobales bacterium]|nr:PAS and helix-turn-helix domain-containing protein [Terriglobales bacterium]
MGERFLFELLAQSGDAAFVIAPDGRIRFWNAAAETLFGYSAAQALDQSCDQLLRGRNAVGALVCRHDCQIRDCGARGKTVPNFDLEVRLPDGDRRWVNFSNLFYRDRRTGETWMVHLARDISGEKSRQQMVEGLLSLMHQLEGQSPAAAAHALEPAAALSVRQRQILRHLAQGQDAAAVASELGITPQSLRNHLHHINRKLNTHDRLGAVTQAQRRHLI